MNNILLEINSLYKSYEDLEILKNINLSINAGEILSIIGPSGGGKTTLLRSIVGLDGQYEGEIYFQNELMHKGLVNSKIGMVFQDYNLFPHLNVEENILIGIRKQNKDKLEYEKILNDILKSLGIENKKNNYPFELSGGEKQRVAIGRALALKPRMICFDEPTSALDPRSINQFKDIVNKLSEENIGVLIITHDMEFAKAISHRIIFLNQGYIIEGLPNEDKIEKFMMGN